RARGGGGARLGAAAVAGAEGPDGPTVVATPARRAARRDPPSEVKPTFQPYAVCGDIPDPIARALNGLLDEVTTLRARFAELENARARERPVLDGDAIGHRALRFATGNGVEDD